MESHSTPARKKVIQIDENLIQAHLGEMVGGTVEQILHQMREAEADRLCNADCYERATARKDTRADHIEACCRRPTR